MMSLIDTDGDGYSSDWNLMEKRLFFREVGFFNENGK